MSRRPLWLCFLAIFLLTLSAHWTATNNQFVRWDDNTHITQNPVIRSLSAHNIGQMFTTSIAKLYCPITWLSFAIDYQIGGQNPALFHFTNLLLHLANTALVFILLHQFLKNLPVATFTAALFGVHPLRVESVAWATERKDVLFGFFFLWGLLQYLRWVAHGKKLDYAACLALFIASALSKSTAVTFPFVLLLLDHFQFRRRVLWEKLPFFAVSLVIGLVTLHAQSQGIGDTVASANSIQLWGRAGLVGYCALFYVGKFFWPFHLSALYHTYDEFHWQPWQAAGWLLALLVITAAIFALRSRCPLLLPAWLFYLVTLAPTIGLAPVGAHVVADRFSYLPLLGLALPLSAGLISQQRWTWLLPSLAVIGLAFLTYQRTLVWHDTGSLFENVRHEDPENYTALASLTQWYTEQENLPRAIAAGEQAVQVAPNGLIARKYLARVYMKETRWRDAVDTLRPAVGHGVDDWFVWSDLHDCFLQLGETQNAAAAEAHMRSFANH